MSICRDGRANKCVFFGNDTFSIPALLALVSKGYVPLIVTNPWKPRGRGKKLLPTPVESVGRELNLPVLYAPQKLSSQQFIECLRLWGAEWGVVVAFRILPAEVLSVFKKGLLNIHPSLLPAYRGPAPVYNAILNGEVETGITIIKITPEVDAGPILAQARVSIHELETRGELESRLASLGACLLTEVIEDWLDGKLKPVKQKGDPIPAPKPPPHPVLIEWNMPAVEILRLIRALNPDPGVIARWGSLSVKILRARLWNIPVTVAASEGTIVWFRKRHVIVKARNSWLELVLVQPPGRRPMLASDWIRGRMNSIKCLAVIN